MNNLSDDHAVIIVVIASWLGVDNIVNACRQTDRQTNIIALNY